MLQAVREFKNLVQDLIWLSNVLREAMKYNPEPRQIELVEDFRQPRAQHEPEVWQTDVEPFDASWILCESLLKPCASKNGENN